MYVSSSCPWARPRDGGTLSACTDPGGDILALQNAAFEVFKCEVSGGGCKVQVCSKGLKASHACVTMKVVFSTTCSVLRDGIRAGGVAKRRKQLILNWERVWLLGSGVARLGVLLAAGVG